MEQSHCELELHLYLGESFGGTARKDTQSNLPNALFRSKDYLLTSKSFIQRQLSSGGIKSHLWRCSDQLSSFSYYFHIIINSYCLFLYQFDKNIILSTHRFHEYQLIVDINWEIKVNNIHGTTNTTQASVWKMFNLRCEKGLK